MLVLLGTKLSQIQDLLRRIAEQLAPLVSTYGLTATGVNSAAASCLTLRFTLKEGTPADAVPCANATFGPLRLENAPIQLIVCLPGIFAIAVALAGAVMLKRAAPNVA